MRGSRPPSPVRNSRCSAPLDRKSTRLNSSHRQISYAVFCLKKKLELEPDGTSLLLRAGVGWKEGCVGRVTVPATEYTQSGFVLTIGEPVVFDDLVEDRRFLP